MGYFFFKKYKIKKKKFKLQLETSTGLCQSTVLRIKIHTQQAADKMDYRIKERSTPTKKKIDMQ